MSAPPRILLDINTWLDIYLSERAGHDAAMALVNHVRDREAHLLFGSSKLETVFYLIQHALKLQARSETGGLSEADALAARAYAWGCIENMQEVATAVGLDGSDLWMATRLRSLSPDFEDNVLLAAAKRADVDYLVTSDRGLLRAAGAIVRAVTPEVMTTILEEGL